MKEKGIIIKNICDELIIGDKNNCIEIINNEYPFEEKKISQRKYTEYDIIKTFIKDGCIDRYTEDKLVNPGVLKIISYYFPKEFPYHPHWKMTETHMAYWELYPTIDHLVPIAQGGADDEFNWVTTSMFTNSKKANWTIEQLGWKLKSIGDFNKWDGLNRIFIKLVGKDKSLLKDSYIKRWYNPTKRVLEEMGYVNKE